MVTTPMEYTSLTLKYHSKIKKDTKFSTKKIGKAFVTDSKLYYFEKHYRENLDMNDYVV